MDRIVSRWTIIPDPKPSASLQLVCFHHAAGGASSYRSWVRRLRPDVEIILVQLPGRENRLSEPALTSVEAVLDGFVPALRSILFGPYAIFGHSLGGSIGHLLACRIAMTGELPLPRHIFLSGLRPPLTGREDRQAKTPRSTAPSDRDLIAHLVRIGGTPAPLLADREFLEMILPSARGDSGLCDDAESRHRCVLDVPLTILQGAEDPAGRTTNPEEWRHLSSAAVRVFTYPGGHFFIQTSRDAVLETMNAVLGSLIQPDRTIAAGE